MGRSCITDSEVGKFLGFHLFYSSSIGVLLQYCPQAGHPPLAAKKGMVHSWRRIHFPATSVPKWNFLLLLLISWGYGSERPISSSSCLIISTDQSHTNKVLVILKHLYGNFRFAKTGKRISSFKSPQINPNENYFKSLNLTGGEWQLLFPTLDITQTSSCSTTNLHSQVWS